MFDYAPDTNETDQGPAQETEAPVPADGGQKETVEQFAARIKSKYPGAYDDKSDPDLVERFITKNPAYADRVETPSNFRLLRTSTGYPKLDDLYEQAGREHNVDPNLLLEQGRQETINFNPDVVYGRRGSPKGAMGAGQFMEGTAPRYGVTDRSDPVQSINGQAKYMRKLLDQFDGREDLALAGYNAGEARKALANGQVPKIAETQDYVARIGNALNTIRSKPGMLAAAAGPNTPTISGPPDIPLPGSRPTPTNPTNVIPTPAEEPVKTDALANLQKNREDLAGALASETIPSKKQEIQRSIDLIDKSIGELQAQPKSTSPLAWSMPYGPEWLKATGRQDNAQSRSVYASDKATKGLSVAPTDPANLSSVAQNAPPPTKEQALFDAQYSSLPSVLKGPDLSPPAQATIYGRDGKPMVAPGSQRPPQTTRSGLKGTKQAGKPVSAPNNLQSEPVVAPETAPQAVSDADYQQYVDAVAKDVQPMTREEFDAAAANAPRGTVTASARTGNPIVGGQEIQADPEQATPDGGAVRFPRLVGNASSGDGIVGTYRYPAGMSKEEAARNAFLNVGRPYGVTGDNYRQYLAKNGPDRELGNFVKGEPGEINITWSALKDAGIDVDTARSMEQAQNLQVQPDLGIAKDTRSTWQALKGASNADAIQEQLDSDPDYADAMRRVTGLEPGKFQQADGTWADVPVTADQQRAIADEYDRIKQRDREIAANADLTRADAEWVKNGLRSVDDFIWRIAGEDRTGKKPGGFFEDIIGSGIGGFVSGSNSLVRAGAGIPLRLAGMPDTAAGRWLKDNATKAEVFDASLSKEGIAAKIANGLGGLVPQLPLFAMSMGVGSAAGLGETGTMIVGFALPAAAQAYGEGKSGSDIAASTASSALDALIFHGAAKAGELFAAGADAAFFRRANSLSTIAAIEDGTATASELSKAIIDTYGTAAELGSVAGGIYVKNKALDSEKAGEEAGVMTGIAAILKLLHLPNKKGEEGKIDYQPAIGRIFKIDGENPAFVTITPEGKLVELDRQPAGADVVLVPQNREARRATAAVPETAPEPETQYTSQLDEIRQKDARTKKKIQALFADAGLSNQQAAELGRQAWGEEWGKPVIAQNPPSNEVAKQEPRTVEPGQSATEAAHDAATSPHNDLPEPTEPQKLAGNYQKGHIKVNGLDISIENPVGSERSGVGPDGTPWSNTMVDHYGYIKRTVGADEEHIDTFVKDGTPADYSGPVFVIDQIDPKTGKFDEHKVMLGYGTEAEARDAYAANYDKNWKGLKSITEMPIDDFKAWVRDGTKEHPAAEELQNERNTGTAAAGGPAAPEGGRGAPGDGQTAEKEEEKAVSGNDQAEKGRVDAALARIGEATKGPGQNHLDIWKDVEQAFQEPKTPLQERIAEMTAAFDPEKRAAVYENYAKAIERLSQRGPDELQRYTPDEIFRGAVESVEDGNYEKTLSRPEAGRANEPGTRPAGQAGANEPGEGSGTRGSVTEASATQDRPADAATGQRSGETAGNAGESGNQPADGSAAPGDAGSAKPAVKIPKGPTPLQKFLADDRGHALTQRIIDAGEDSTSFAELRKIGKNYGLSERDVRGVIDRGRENRQRAENKRKATDVIRETRQPKGPTLEGSATTILTPESSKEYDARYVVREAGDIYPSHDPTTFQPNPDYYYTNDRHYNREEQYQKQVIDRSKAFKPQYFVTDTPTAADGPPVIDAEGNVLGGNSRAMILKRIYAAEDPAERKAYQVAMHQKAAQFGLDPADLLKFDRPVLVREISDDSINRQHAITELNETSTTDLTTKEQAVADAGKLSDEAVEYITNKIAATGADATLTEALNAHGVAVVNHLIEDGVLGEGERNKYIDNGEITADGKKRIERLLLGKVFTDLDQIENATPSVNNTVIRIVAPLMKVNADPEWNILPEVQEGIELINEAKAAGQGRDIAGFANHVNFLRPEGWSPQAVAIAETLNLGQVKASEVFKQYAEDMRLAKYSDGAMFDMGSKTQPEAFRDAFGVEPADQQARASSSVTLPSHKETPSLQAETAVEPAEQTDESHKSEPAPTDLFGDTFNSQESRNKPPTDLFGNEITPARQEGLFGNKELADIDASVVAEYRKNLTGIFGKDTTDYILQLTESADRDIARVAKDIAGAAKFVDAKGENAKSVVENASDALDLFVQAKNERRTIEEQADQPRLDGVKYDPQAVDLAKAMALGDFGDKFSKALSEASAAKNSEQTTDTAQEGPDATAGESEGQSSSTVQNDAAAPKYSDTRGLTPAEISKELNRFSKSGDLRAYSRKVANMTRDQKIRLAENLRAGDDPDVAIKDAKSYTNDVDADLEGTGGGVSASPSDPINEAFGDYEAMAGNPRVRMFMSDLPVEGYEKGKTSSTDVIKSYENVLNAVNSPTPIRSGRGNFAQRQAEGWYNPHTEIIRLRTANNIPTAGHEIGHAAQKYIYGRVKGSDLKTLPDDVKRELVKMGKDLYGDRKPAAGYGSEGVAEFMRYYLTGEEAGKVAPHTLKWFETEILPNHEEFAKALQKAKDTTTEYRLQGAANRAKADTVKGGTLSEKIRDAKRALSHLTTQMVDEFTPLLRLSKDVERITGEQLRPEDDPFKVASFLRGNASAVTHYFVFEGTMDFARNKVGPPLDEATSIVRGKLEEFTQYLKARRSQELLAQGINPGMTRQDADTLVNLYDSPEFQMAAEGVYRWNDDVLNYVKQSSPELAATIDKIFAKGWRNYVPLMREFDDVDLKAIKRINQGGGNPMKRIKGSGRRVKDIFPQMIANAEKMIALAHRQKVTNTIVDLANVPGMGHIIEEVPVDRIPHSTSIESIRKQLEEQGADLSEVDLDQMVTFFSPAYTPKGLDPIVPVMRGGQMKWYQVNEDLYNSMSGLDLYRMPKVLDILLGMPTRAFRLGTTGLRPAFSLVTNPTRDLQTFAMQSATSNPAKLLANYFVSMAEALNPKRIVGKNNVDMDMFLRLGANLAQPLGADTAITRRTGKELFQGKVRRVVMHPIEMARELLSVTEAVPRVAEIRNLAKEVNWDGQGPITFDQAVQLGLGAKQVTVDFTAAGSVGKKLNQAIPFFNANVQGVRQFGKNVRERPVRTALYGLSALTIPTLALWWQNKDKDWYKDMPTRERMMYWNIEAGDKILQIPRAFEYGNTFSVVPETVADAWYQQDPQGVKEALGYIFDTTVPPGPLDTPLLRTAKEEWSNRIAFFDRPIVPKGQEDTRPGEQYSAGTTEFAKLLGRYFPDTISPARVDHIVRGLGGGTPIDIQKGVEQLVGLKPPKERQASDIFAVGKLFRPGGTVGYNSKAIDKFYEEYGRLQQLSRSKDPSVKEEGERFAEAQKIAEALKILREQNADDPTADSQAARTLLMRSLAQKFLEGSQQQAAGPTKPKPPPKSTIQTREAANRRLERVLGERNPQPKPTISPRPQ